METSLKGKSSKAVCVFIFFLCICVSECFSLIVSFLLRNKEKLQWTIGIDLRTLASKCTLNG